jgi:hypothetical protein
MRMLSIGSMLAAVSAALGLAGGCSSSSGGGGGIPCSDAGTCEGNQVCEQGLCVTPPGTGGTGAGGAATGGVGGGTGGTGGGVPQGCSAACATAALAGCSAFSQSACEAECASDYAKVPTNCLGSYDSLLACAAAASWQCDGTGDAEPIGCDAEIGVLTDCLMNNTGGTGGTGGGGTGGTSGTGGTGGTGGGTVPDVTPLCVGLPETAPSGGSCYSSGVCNPVTNSGCTGEGEACDLSDNGFTCFGPPNETPCGGSCDNSTGPFCLPGHVCLGSGMTKCARYCCTDADCGSGSCIDLSAAFGQPMRICGSAAP